MPRVNLLPWRDEIRQDRERRFYITLAIAAVAMVAVIGLAQLTIRGLISDQQNRNKILTTEITRLNEQIKEINELQTKKNALLARMDIIQSLQGTRPLVVHLFDALVRTLPEGAYTSSISQSGNKLNIQGFAQSNARVSAFMRNIEASEWLTDPTLTVIRTAESDQGKTSQFNLRAKQWSPTADEDNDNDKNSRRKKAKKR